MNQPHAHRPRYLGPLVIPWIYIVSMVGCICICKYITKTRFLWGFYHKALNRPTAGIGTWIGPGPFACLLGGYRILHRTFRRIVQILLVTRLSHGPGGGGKGQDYFWFLGYMDELNLVLFAFTPGVTNQQPRRLRSKRLYSGSVCSIADF